MSATILLVEDDEMIRSLIKNILKTVGYNVFIAGSSLEMFTVMKSTNFDLVVMDLNLPDEDGIVLTRKIRARLNIPIIILTSRNTIEDRISGLRVGADDFLTKSVDPEEFLLRIRNLLNRTLGNVNNSLKNPEHNTIHFSGWKLDVDGFSLVDQNDQEVDLTPAELKLLAILARNSGRVMTREHLLDSLSTDIDGPSDRMIDACISRIREKIEANPSNPEKIITVTGSGYKFAAEID